MKFTITHLTGSMAGAVQHLEGDVVSVGRAPGNLLRFDPERDDKVSGFHAKLEAQGEHVVLQDLGSSNGTFLNGTRLSGPTAVVPGAVLTFGEGGPNVSVVFEAAAAPPPSGPAGATSPAAASRPAAVPSSSPASRPPAAAAGPSSPAAAGRQVAPASPAAPPPAAGKPAKGKGGRTPLALLGFVGGFVLLCLLSSLLLAFNKQVRSVMPPGAMRYLRRIPVVGRLFTVPSTPRLPGGVQAPRVRLPSGGGADEPDEDAPVEQGQDDQEAQPAGE